MRFSGGEMTLQGAVDDIPISAPAICDRNMERGLLIVMCPVLKSCTPAAGDSVPLPHGTALGLQGPSTTKVTLQQLELPTGTCILEVCPPNTIKIIVHDLAPRNTDWRCMGRVRVCLHKECSR